MKIKIDTLPIPTLLLLASIADGSPLPRTSSLHRRYADVYDMYTGNGSPAEGWPLEDAWVPSFDTIFQLNTGTLLISCAQFNAPDNSPEEIQGIYNGVVQVSKETGVDPRFIFAIIMQESTGCVRAPTTNGGVMNPGLMQDHNGTASCNTAGAMTTPCPQDTITQMIRDGTAGTPYGDGLVQLLSQSGVSDVQKYYMAARMYNSGSIAEGGDLGAGGSTHCYASDIANRLTGWVHAAHACCLNAGCYGGASTYASTPVTGWWSTETTAAIVPSWLSYPNPAAAPTATEPSTYIVTIQPSAVTSVLSEILTDTSASYPSQIPGGIFAPVSESVSLAPASSTLLPLLSSETPLSTSQASSAALTTEAATATSPSVGGANTYVLTLGTQTMTYTVQPNDIYWAEPLSPYVYWAATSTPSFPVAPPTDQPTAIPAPTLNKRASYEAQYTTMLVDVPVNVPVPYETKTASWTATVTTTVTVRECDSSWTQSATSSQQESGPWAPWYSVSQTAPIWISPVTATSSSHPTAYPTPDSSHAYPTWTSSWAAPSNSSGGWHPTWTASSYPTGYPTGYSTGSWNNTRTWGTAYPTGLSTGLPSGQPYPATAWKPWIWPNLAPSSSPEARFDAGRWTVHDEGKPLGGADPRAGSPQ